MIRLTALGGPHAGRPVALRHGDSLGRLPDCALVAIHASVSRIHARIEERDDGFWVVDAGSRNGLHVGSKRVGEVKLAPGVEFRLGEFPLRVDPAATTATASSTASSTAGSRVPSESPIEESFEFAVGDAGAPRSPATGAGAAPEIALEDPADIALGSAPTRAPAATRPIAVASPAQIRQAEFLAEDARSRSGLARGELTQQPIAIQLLVFAAVLGVGGGIAWLVYALVVAGA